MVLRLQIVGSVVQPSRHLFSGYVDYIGEEFGLDGMKAAQGDRFLHEVRRHFSGAFPAKFQGCNKKTPPQNCGNSEFLVTVHGRHA